MKTLVVDSSVVMAILLVEPASHEFARIMALCRLKMSAGTRIELEQVALARRGAGGSAALRTFLDPLAIEYIPVDEAQMTVALDAARRYGRGANPMILNYGDLFSYALAKTSGLPLLYKGDDFGRTDVLSAWDDPELSALLPD